MIPNYPQINPGWHLKKKKKAELKTTQLEQCPDSLGPSKRHM